MKHTRTYPDNSINNQVEEAIAWLKKQGEQKPADKVEPKFHERDWIVMKTDNVYEVTAIIDDKYQLKYGDNYTVQKYADVDKNARVWTIEDAKDGDVLKSFRYKKQWKPTEAQLVSLEIACDRNDRVGFDLTQLLKDLKKLTK